MNKEFAKAIFKWADSKDCDCELCEDTWKKCCGKEIYSYIDNSEKKSSNVISYPKPIVEKQNQPADNLVKTVMACFAAMMFIGFLLGIGLMYLIKG